MDSFDYKKYLAENPLLKETLSKSSKEEEIEKIVKEKWQKLYREAGAQSVMIDDLPDSALDKINDKFKKEAEAESESGIKEQKETNFSIEITNDPKTLKGTSADGYCDSGITYEDLVKIFGEPIKYDHEENYKTQVEWIGLLDGKVFTIYDYEGHNYKPVEELEGDDFHIGSKRGGMSDLINEYISLKKQEQNSGDGIEEELENKNSFDYNKWRRVFNNKPIAYIQVYLKDPMGNKKRYKAILIYEEKEDSDSLYFKELLIGGWGQEGSLLFAVSNMQNKPPRYLGVDETTMFEDENRFNKFIDGIKNNPETTIKNLWTEWFEGDLESDLKKWMDTGVYKVHKITIEKV